MTCSIIKIGMGEGVVASAPQVIVSEGIGSCVVLTLYNPLLKIGGMAHIMLPESMSNDRPQGKGAKRGAKKRSSPFQYAVSATDALVMEMLKAGTGKWNIEAKIAGGARMFPADIDAYPLGKLTSDSVKRVLKERQIRLAAWDVGGHHGRSVEFCLETGRMVIKGIGVAGKEI